MVVARYIGVLNFESLFEHLDRILVLLLLHVGETLAMPELRIIFTDFNSSVEVLLSLLILSHSEEGVASVEEEIRIRRFNFFLVEFNGLIEVVESVIVSLSMEEDQSSVVVVKCLLRLQVDSLRELIECFIVVSLIKVRAT